MRDPHVEPGMDLRLVRTFAAPRAAVFRAWTDPELLVRWWGPGAWAEVDLRPGGRYRLGMRWPNGMTMCATGTFRDVAPGERLVYTFGWEGEDSSETLVTVEFKDAGAGTELHLIHEGFTAAEVRDNHGQGWSDCIDRLEALAVELA